VRWVANLETLGAMPFLRLISTEKGRKASRFVNIARAMLITAAVAAPAGGVQGQQNCPQPAERTDRMMKGFLAHPLVADPPYPSEAGLPADYMDILGPERERIDLVGLMWEEVESLTQGNEEWPAAAPE
jgi:hypothetical protein